MIELTVYNFLKTNLSTPVFMEIPKDYPSQFVVIEKTSGAQVNHINSSTIAIKSYSDSLYKAAVLNDEVVEAMLNELITESDIASVKLNSSYNFTDTSTKQYRYQAVFDIVHY